MAMVEDKSTFKKVLLQKNIVSEALFIYLIECNSWIEVSHNMLTSMRNNENANYEI